MLRQNMSDDELNHFRLTRFSIKTKRNEKEKIQILWIKYDLFKQTRAINKPIETVSTCIHIRMDIIHCPSLVSFCLSLSHTRFICV